MQVHCENCDKDYPIKDFDISFHQYGSCKDQINDYEGWSFFDKHWIEILFVILAVSFVGIVALLTYLDVIPPQPVTECFVSHVGTINQLNENNRITYDEPREICDIRIIKVGEKTFGYTYSYTIQKEFGKSFHIVKPSCDDKVFDYTTRFDKETMNFICKDGSIAREYSVF